MAWNDSRPLSPHLQIYKLPPTALMSVLHRGTGVVLCIGTLMLVLILASAASGADAYASTHWWISSWFGYLVLIGFTFSVYAHFCNGIRHLIWDLGYGFDIENATKGAKVSFGAAILLTVLTWIVALAA
ncbi:succinate dehydrogenase, cytochrome b556 subunit [Chromatiales bacterium (ex Bugula neritina AB1)]|nr:succinate dehydrogenase, cytochrome b556 subunit [Chromatiales bacterium (ex Bugula neritina AB1)]